MDRHETIEHVRGQLGHSEEAEQLIERLQDAWELLDLMTSVFGRSLTIKTITIQGEMWEVEGV
jgi:hypothetical protein